MLVLKASPNRYASSGNVTVTPGSSDTGKATVSTALTFTTSNWYTPQTVTVSGVAAGSSTVSHNVSGGGYGSITVGSVAVTSGTLSASAVTATTATLTLTNHTGKYYYQYTVPTTPAGTCSTVVSSGTTTASLTDLVAATRYTFKAYSDSNCSAANVLASETFLTKPGRVTGVTTAVRDMGLELGWAVVTGYKVQ